MKVIYFEETDTLFLRLSESDPVETRELNDNIYVDLDSGGKVISITIEHAKERQGFSDFSYETVAA